MRIFLQPDFLRLGRNLSVPVLGLFLGVALPVGAEEAYDANASYGIVEQAPARTMPSYDAPVLAGQGSVQDEAPVSSGLSCIESFHETRSKVLGNNLQSVLMLSSTNGVAPYITLQTKSDDDRRYILWQTLNGEIRGYALRDGKGFDYTNSAGTPLPLSWHPTLIWDNLFNSNKEPRNYSCVLTGRTRVMGKRVIITGVTFPVSDDIFDRLEQTQLPMPSSLGQNSSLTGTVHESTDTVTQEAPQGSWQAQNFKDRVARQGPAAGGRDNSIQLVLPEPTESAGATVDGGGLSDGVQSRHDLNNAVALKRWPELNIPTVYNIVAEGRFDEGGPDCIYQEYSDGLTSFRVYRNRVTTIYYPVLTNGTISIVRKQNSRYEYSVVGEVPVNLAEFVLARIGAQ